MDYLVTGGCGFIGSHITQALVADGHHVRVYDNLSSGYEHNLAAFRDSVEFINADVRDVDALASAMKGIRYVFHEAALVSVFDSVERPVDNNEINITGTLNVLNVARESGVKRVLFAGSAAAYGNNPTLPKTEDMTPEPESPYGLAKVTGEYYMRVFANLFDIETVVLRYFNVYGPRQDPSSMYSGVISKFVDVVTSGANPTVFGDGGQTRDFVFVGDIVQANLLGMHAEGVGKGEIFNVGTGNRTSLLDLLAVLKDLTGKEFETGFKPERAGDIRHSVADITRAREKLGYEPKHTVHEGLKALLESKL